MARTILIHLNVVVPDGDDRSVEDIEGAIRGALEVGSDDDAISELEVEFLLSEEI